MASILSQPQCVNWVTATYKNGRVQGVGVTKLIFSVPLFSQFFRMIKTLHDIKFIFDRCHHSWAVETPAKYEHDWKYMYLTYTFAKSKFPVTEKLTNGALVTPTPE